MTSLSRFQWVGKWMQGGPLFVACLASAACTRSHDASHNASPPVTLAVSTPTAVGSVVLVVGMPLRESDRRLQTRIEIRTGLPVAVIADSGATNTAVSGAKAIVVSESADSAAIGGRLREVAVPQLISEPSLFDDMGFTGPKWSDDYGDSTSDSELFVLLPNSELAAMLPSPTAVFNNANKAVWGKPQGAVQRVATIGSATDPRTAIFAYEKAAGIIGGSAAERRVGWFAGRDAPLSFTSQAWQLFDSSLFWLLRMDPNNRPEPPERKALLVVGPGELSTSDQALRQRLESSFGLLTLVSNDDRFSVDMARHAEFVLFSETVRSEQIAGAIQKLTVPVFAMEPALFPRLGFTGTGWQSDFGDSEGQAHIRILKDTPLSAGRSGQVAVTTVGRKFVWARPKGDALVTASLSNDASKAAIFSYESDSKLADGSLTPARRIGWFGGRFVPETLTPEGWVLFDSAVAWISRARALLTVGPSPLSNGDKRMRDRLGELGFVVRVRNDSSVKPADFEEQHLVVVSQSVRSNELKSVLTAQATAVPMLVMEPALFDDLGLTGDEQSGGFGIETGQTSLAITSPQHPLAATLSGTQSVAAGPAAFAWGKPASSSIVVARSLTQTDHALVFAYDEGATLVSGEKNAFRKVGWFASDGGFESLNAQGQQMFDSAVGWTSGRSRVRPRVQHAPGARAKEFLSTIADPEERGRTAFVVLSTMAALRRVSEGRATSPLEGKLVDFWNNADFFTRKQLVNVGNALDGFTQAERANLLGPFANLDPGDGRSITPPAILAAQVAQVPRIRANACTGNSGYEGDLDSALAQRSVTTGGEIIARLSNLDPDGGATASANLSAPAARPRLSGIQKTEDVRGYDAAIGRPSLEDDRLRNRDCGVRGDGISPYGVLTDIACSPSAPCDQEAGLICGSDLRASFLRSGFLTTRCYAFPVLSPKGSVVMRGHNFWDTSDAQLEYRPLSDPSAQPTLVGLSEPGVVGNEGIDQLPNCALPVGRGSPGSRECKATEDTANRNHNSASFPVPAGLAGGFFNLRLMNHNTDQPGGATVLGGKVRHWQSPGEAGRVLHVCYPASAPPGKLTDLDNLTFSPFDTRTTCVPPTTSCQDNTTTFGACSAGTWSSLPGGRPRSLSECRHSPGSDPVCGETPEWIYSEPELVEGRPRPALVFVASSVRPTFKLTGRLYGVRCFEETGWDWTGSDELRVVGTAWTNDASGGSNPTNGVALKWEGGGFDSQAENKVRTYPRRVTPPAPLFLAQPVNIDQQVLFTLSLLERDCDDGDTVCRVTEVSIGVGVAVAVVFATAYLCPPCAAFLTTSAGIGASAIGASAYVATLYELSANDAIGTQFFTGTPIDFGERFTKSHAAIPNGPLSQFVPPGPLLRFPASGEKGTFTNNLVFPDVDQGTFAWDRPFNPAETASPDGKIIGFREWRRIKGGGADYLTQILWQRISCATPQECQTPVNPDPTKP